MVKPLKDLIAEADKFLGQTKTAAPVVSDEVSSLADTLAFATEIENKLSATDRQFDSEFEKVAVALNKVAAEVELDILSKVEKFEKVASEKGYNKTQIDEALSKIAAAKIKNNLQSLIYLNDESRDMLSSLGVNL